MKPIEHTATIDEGEDIDQNVDANVDEYALPCAEALLAGTLALMTGYARCGCAVHRQMMAEKAAANLLALAKHSPLSSQLTSGFKTIVFKLHSQWLDLVEAEQRVLAYPSVDAVAQTHLPIAEQSRAEQSRALWHKTPEVIQ